MDRIHDVIHQAVLCFGESATMSAESAVLGVPAIFVDQQGRGYTTDIEEKYNLVYKYKPNQSGMENAIERGLEIVRNRESDYWSQKREQLLNDTIDVTAFMTWLIEHYPESIQIIRENPEFRGYEEA